jgi:murein DD-endopeptidase MepM/ murein hydrolase activator NlpD
MTRRIIVLPRSVCGLPVFSRRSSSGMCPTLALCSLALMSACAAPLDYDLRGQIGAFNTTQAAQTATELRPTPDARGLITFPSYQVAVARRGDSLTTVADRIGLPAPEIARLNGIKVDDPLRKGEVLVLPRRAPSTVPGAATSGPNPGGVDIAALAGPAIENAAASSPNPGSVTAIELQEGPQPAASRPRVQDGPEPIRHKVTRGETAYTISRLYQVPVKSLSEWNGLGSDFAVREGQLLLIPVKDQTAPGPKPKPAITPVVAAPGQGSATPEPPSASKPLPEEEVAPASQVAPQPAPTVVVAKPTRKAESAMGYPVKGKIIRAYAKGKNDGIDISGVPGAPVQAAESGTVAAITEDSNKIPILVLRHENNLLSVYANVQGIRVRKGERVDRGQTIASLRQDDSEEVYVHFEIRDGFESVDPLLYLN